MSCLLSASSDVAPSRKAGPFVFAPFLGMAHLALLAADAASPITVLWLRCRKGRGKHGDRPPSVARLIPHRKRTCTDLPQTVADLDIDMERVENQRGVAQRHDRLVLPINGLMLPETTESVQVARLVVDAAAGMHVAEPVIEEAIKLALVARQHGCISLVLQGRYRSCDVLRHCLFPIARTPATSLAFDEAIRCDRKFAHASAGGMPDCIRDRAESQSHKATVQALYVHEWLRKMRDTPMPARKELPPPRQA
jgi:hypothetical protein